jgi:hypothetical protein
MTLRKPEIYTVGIEVKSGGEPVHSYGILELYVNADELFDGLIDGIKLETKHKKRMAEYLSLESLRDARRKYADDLGIEVEQLSDDQKRTAILNAVIE